MRCADLSAIAIVVATAASNPPKPFATKWYAPFLAGGGYSSEAISYALELERILGEQFGIVQFAEQADHKFVAGVPSEALAVLQRQMMRHRHGPSIQISLQSGVFRFSTTWCTARMRSWRRRAAPPS